jgi:hypothetical protein
MTTRTQAERALQLLDELNKLNQETGGDLIRKAYAPAFAQTYSSISRRLVTGKFEDEGPMPFMIV